MDLETNTPNWEDALTGRIDDLVASIKPTRFFTFSRRALGDDFKQAIRVCGPVVRADGVSKEHMEFVASQCSTSVLETLNAAGRHEIFSRSKRVEPRDEAWIDEPFPLRPSVYSDDSDAVADSLIEPFICRESDDLSATTWIVNPEWLQCENEIRLCIVGDPTPPHFRISGSSIAQTIYGLQPCVDMFFTQGDPIGEFAWTLVKREKYSLGM